MLFHRLFDFGFGWIIVKTANFEQILGWILNWRVF